MKPGNTGRAQAKPQPQPQPRLLECEKDVKKLEEMGFGREEAREALQKEHGKLIFAIIALTDKLPIYKGTNSRCEMAYTKLMGSKETSDIMFRVGKEQAVFTAHKFILANASELFNKMFFSGLAMKEAVEPTINEDSDPATFQGLLEYCYTYKVQHMTLELALKLFTVAEKYMIPNFKLYLLKALEQLLTVGNALQAYKESEAPILVPLHEYVIAYICINAEKVLSPSNALNELPKEQVISLLNLPLCVYERVILARAVNYVQAHADLSAPIKARRESMQDVLKLVRLSNLGTSSTVRMH